MCVYVCVCGGEGGAHAIVGELRSQNNFQESFSHSTLGSDDQLQVASLGSKYSNF